MKTSSYDDPDEEAENVADEYLSYEAPTYEAQTDYQASDEQHYEASFAKCKVTPIAESNEEEIVDSFEMSFAKCSVSSAAVNDREQVDVSHEESIAESYRTPIVETIEIVAVNEAPVASVTPQYDNFTSNMPPPVPKRTLLPSKSTKEVNVVTETPQHESSAAEEADAQNVAYRDIELVSPEEVTQKTETGAERWSDSTSVSIPGQVEDVETVSSDPGNAQCEPVSEMYYTASSEVSLLSDTEVADKVQNEEDEQTKDDRKNVIAGHVAAMRERFESMTRTNTPCPDLARSLSPSLEVFRNLSPSPDRLA